MNHAAAAAEFVADEAHAHWHDQALWFIRAKRDKCAHSLPEWEELRERAAAIKRHVIAHLADLLEQFEANATRLGATVHWARDADEHNRIVAELLERHGVRRVVKSKSMLTEECPQPSCRHGIEVVDTDLGERIVQLRDEPPSHIARDPLKKVSAAFPSIGTEGRPIQNTWPRRRAAESSAADAGLTGINFAIAEPAACLHERERRLGRRSAAHRSMGLKTFPRTRTGRVFACSPARPPVSRSPPTRRTFTAPRPGANCTLCSSTTGAAICWEATSFAARCIAFAAARA
jgi:L-lactate dehydrogenase complex protein LldF